MRPRRRISEHKGKTFTKSENLPDECSHYWIIDSPNGPTSKGICKYCRKVTLFSNTLPENVYLVGRSLKQDNGTSKNIDNI